MNSLPVPRWTVVLPIGFARRLCQVGATCFIFRA